MGKIAIRSSILRANAGPPKTDLLLYAKNGVEDSIGLSVKRTAGVNLIPVDWLPARLFCSDGTYMYGSLAGQTSYKLYRWSSRTAEPVEIVNFQTLLEPDRFPISVFAANGQLFAVLKDGAASKSALYRSTDHGETWDFCFLLGDVDGTTANQIVNVEILPRGLVYHSRSGKWVMGEYVYNPGTLVGSFVTHNSVKYECIQSHTSSADDEPGVGVNSADYWRVAVTLETPAAWALSQSYTQPDTASPVRIMSSTDGLTWNQELIWNETAAALPYNTMRHVHGMAVDPWTQDIFIVCGDDAVHAGILRWDGEATLANNKRIAEFDPATDGSTGVGGHRKYRLVDVLFDSDYVYGMADDPGESSRGVWRINRSLDESTSYRLDDRIGDNAYHVGYVGLNINGNMMFSEFLESASATPNVQFWTSFDGNKWEPTAVFNCVTGTTGGTLGFFQHDNEIYFTHGGAGKVDLNTAVFEIDGEALLYEPQRVLHPVYWLDPVGGVNSTANYQGYRPSIPWKNLQYALTGERVTHGARVILPAGDATETAILAAYSSHTRASDPTFPLIIEGAGITETHVSGGSSYLIYLSEAMLPIVLKDAKFSCSGDSGFPNVIQVANATAAKQMRCFMAEVNDLVLSAVGNGVRSFSLGNNVVLNFDYSISQLAANADFAGFGTNTVLDIDFSKVLGGKNIAYMSTAGVDFRLKNSIAKGFAETLYVTAAGSTIVPTVKNSIIERATAGHAMIDGAGLTETDASIDYNLINGTVSGLANNGGSNSIFSEDPLFTDPDNGDFTLQAGSPCIGAGTDPFTDGDGDQYDADGYKVWDDSYDLPDGHWIDGVDIGAYAYGGASKYYPKLSNPSEGVWMWESAPDILDITGVNNAVYNLDGTGKSFATQALAFAAFASLADDVQIFAGDTQIAIYSTDQTANADRINQRIK